MKPKFFFLFTVRALSSKDTLSVIETFELEIPASFDLMRLQNT